MNELDKIFQSKLENHTADYSPQSWAIIQARLEKQKTQPPKLPWFWMSFAITALMWAILFFMPSDSNSTLSTDVNNNSAKQHFQKDTDNEKASNNYAKVKEIVPNKNVAEIGIDVNDLEDQINVEKTTSSEEEALATNSTTTNTSNNGLTFVTNADLKDEVEYDLKIGTTAEQLDGEIKLSDVSNASDNEFVNFSNKDVLVATRVPLLVARPLRTIGVSSFTKIYSESKKSEYLELSKTMMDDFRQDCPSFVTDRTGIYLDFYFSHELPFSSLSAKDGELRPYQELRLSTEDPAYSFSTGARLTLMLPNGLGLKTGINYSQVNEKFSYVDSESDLIKEVITITTVDGMEVRDTNILIIPGTRDVVSTNKYRSFDIPLLLSYEWDVRERTYMTINGGIYLNLLFKESGKILDPRGEIIDLVDTSGDKLAIFKNNIGLSLFGSVGLHYRWNSNIDFILEPNVRVLMKSATVESYLVEHKWITGGLITGMRYNF